jgi:hypothetical protein
MAEDRFESTIPKIIIAVKEYERLKEIEKSYLENQAHLKEKFAIKDKGNFFLSIHFYNIHFYNIHFYNVHFCKVHFLCN